MYPRRCSIVILYVLCVNVAYFLNCVLWHISRLKQRDVFSKSFTTTTVQLYCYCSGNLDSPFTQETKQRRVTNQKQKQCSFWEQEIKNEEFYLYTKKFKYLGSIFTSSKKDDEDIKRRISQACGAFAQAEKILCNHKMTTT